MENPRNIFFRTIAIPLIILSAMPAFLFESTATTDSLHPKRIPKSGADTVIRHAQFSSRFVDARDVEVWLPPSHATSTTKRYPVLYMHDGQNVFNPKTAYGGIDWGVDETMTRLVREGKVREAIVVGVWNTPKRYNEYMPRKAAPSGKIKDVAGLPVTADGSIVSDDYLKFLISELKPFIDKTYRTLPDRNDTFVMGSSMGGLVSAYAVCEYPEIFGGAGCVSTHWPAGDGIVIDYLKTHLPDPKTHKFYFDYGTATLDAEYEPYQFKADEVMKKAGYRQGKNWITRKFPGAEHSEKSWRERVEVPIRFLLGK